MKRPALPLSLLLFAIPALLVLTCTYSGTGTHKLTTNAIPENGGFVTVNGEASTGTSTHREGDRVTVTAIASEGYTFDRWSGASTSTDTAVTVVMNRDLTLTANFLESQLVTYTLTAIAAPPEGGTVYVDGEVSTDASTHSAGSSVTVTAVASAGYTFAGWSGASTSTRAAIAVVMSDDRTLTANFRAREAPPAACTLTVSAAPANGGTVFVNGAASTGRSTHSVGAEVELEAVAEDDFIFTGWSGASESTDSVITVTMDSALTVTANFQLKDTEPPGGAVYTLEVSVSPADGGAVFIGGEEIVSGEKPADTLRLDTDTVASLGLRAVASDGYVFDMWTLNGSVNVSTDTITLLVRSNYTVVATFKLQEQPPATYTLTTGVAPATGGFVTVDGEVSSGSSTHSAGDSVTVTAVATAGYKFTGWTGASADTGAAVTIAMSRDLALTANFQVVGITYTVTFNANGGSPTPAAQTVAQGEKATQPANPTRAQYTLDGWYSDSALTRAWNFDVNTVTANTTLRAKWTRTHTITFDANGGSPTPPQQTVVRGGKVTRPTDPTLDGHTLDGWYNTAALATEWDFEVDTASASITLRAKWTPVSVTPTTFTVTFNSNGGSDVAPLTAVASGEKITAPTPPIREGYTFDKWYKEEGLTTEWVFGTDAVTANVTLYAKWTPGPVTPTTFTVTFNSNGGSSVASLTAVASGDKITAPTPPTLYDHTFDGWYKEEGLTTQWIFGTDTVTADVTLYAKWTEVDPPDDDPPTGGE